MGAFADVFIAFTKKTKARAIAVHGHTTVLLQQAIIKDSPILTGRTKANWQATANTPAVTSIYARVPKMSRREKRGLVFGVHAYLNEIEQTKRNGKEEMRKIGVDAKTYIANCVEYVVTLEYAPYRSKQAPQGMARINTVRFESFVQQALGMAVNEHP